MLLEHYLQNSDIYIFKTKFIFHDHDSTSTLTTIIQYIFERNENVFEQLQQKFSRVVTNTIPPTRKYTAIVVIRAPFGIWNSRPHCTFHFEKQHAFNSDIQLNKIQLFLPFFYRNITFRLCVLLFSRIEKLYIFILCWARRNVHQRLDYEIPFSKKKRKKNQTSNIHRIFSHIFFFIFSLHNILFRRDDDEMEPLNSPMNGGEPIKRDFSAEFDGRVVHSRNGDIIGKNSAV